MKFHHLGHNLLDTNCLLLILKMFGLQEISQLVVSKADSPENKCVLESMNHNKFLRVVVASSNSVWIIQRILSRTNLKKTLKELRGKLSPELSFTPMAKNMMRKSNKFMNTLGETFSRLLIMRKLCKSYQRDARTESGCLSITRVRQVSLQCCSGIHTHYAARPFSNAFFAWCIRCCNLIYSSWLRVKFLIVVDGGDNVCVLLFFCDIIHTIEQSEYEGHYCDIPKLPTWSSRRVVDRQRDWGRTRSSGKFVAGLPHPLCWADFRLKNKPSATS